LRATFTPIAQWVNLILLLVLAKRRNWTAPGRTLGLTVAGVVLACLGLAVVAIYGQGLAQALVPALTHGRELAVLALLGLAGAAVYGGLLAGLLHLFGLRLRRA
jgi:putative peptidoglycan lipid II flippase